MFPHSEQTIEGLSGESSSSLKCLMDSLCLCRQAGGLAQMVERSLSMREVPGSIPGSSTFCFFFFFFFFFYSTRHFVLPKHVPSLCLSYAS